MESFINKFINLLLILLLSILVLNRYYVIDFDITLRNVFIYLALIIILLTALKEILIGAGFNKVVGILIIVCAIVGGVVTVVTNQINIFIYACLIISLIHSIMELVYNK